MHLACCNPRTPTISLYRMNCSRTDHRRQIDFSAVKDPTDSLGRAIQGLLSRRRDPLSHNDIAKWFRGTPREFVESVVVIIAGRGWIKSFRGTRGVEKYYMDNWE